MFLQKVKRCGDCRHGLDSGSPEQVYCIAHPPTMIATAAGVFSHFPMMLKRGKCGEFSAGKTQTENKE